MVIGYTTAIPKTAYYIANYEEGESGGGQESQFQNASSSVDNAFGNFVDNGDSGGTTIGNSEGGATTANGTFATTFYTYGETDQDGGEPITASNSFSSSGVAWETSATSRFPISTSVGTTSNTPFTTTTNTTFSFTYPTTATSSSITGTTTSTFNTTASTTGTYEQSTTASNIRNSTFIDTLWKTYSSIYVNVDYVNSTIFLAANEVAWIFNNTIGTFLSNWPLSAIAYSTTGAFTIPNTFTTAALPVTTIYGSTSGVSTIQPAITESSQAFTSVGFTTLTRNVTLSSVGANLTTTNSNYTTNSNSTVPDHIKNSSWTTSYSTVLATFQDSFIIYVDSLFESSNSNNLAAGWATALTIFDLNTITTGYSLAYDSNGLPTGFKQTVAQTSLTSAVISNAPINLACLIYNDESGGVSIFVGSTGSVPNANWGFSAHAQMGSLSVITPQKSGGVCLPDSAISARNPYYQITFANGITFPTSFVFGDQSSIFTPLPILGSTTTMDYSTISATSSSAGSTFTTQKSTATTSYSINWSSLSLSATSSNIVGTTTNSSTFNGVLGVAGAVSNPEYSITSVTNLAIGGAGVDTRGIQAYFPKSLLDITQVDNSSSTRATSTINAFTTSFETSSAASAANIYGLYDVVLGGQQYIVFTNNSANP